MNRVIYTVTRANQNHNYELLCPFHALTLQANNSNFDSNWAMAKTTANPVIDHPLADDYVFIFSHRAMALELEDELGFTFLLYLGEG